MAPPRGILCVLACLVAACAGCARTACWHWPSYEPPVVAGGSSRLEMARLGEQIGRTDLAARFYQDVLEREPDNAVAHHRLGTIAAKEGRWGEADQHFTEAQRLGGLNAELLTDMAQAQYERKQWRCAERNLRQALELEPENAKSRSLLALVLGEQGKHRESMAQFREVVRGSDAKSNVDNVAQQLAPHGKDLRADAEHRTREQLAAAGVTPGIIAPPTVETRKIVQPPVIVQRAPVAKPTMQERPRPVATNSPQVVEAPRRVAVREASKPAVVKQSRDTSPRIEPLADHKAATPVEALGPRNAPKVPEVAAPVPAARRPSPEGVVVRIDGLLAPTESPGLPKARVETNFGQRLVQTTESRSPPERQIALKSGVLSSENRSQNKTAKETGHKALNSPSAEKVIETPRSDSRGVLSRTSKKAAHAATVEKPAVTASSASPVPSLKPAPAKVAETSAKSALPSKPALSAAPPVTLPKFPGQLTSFETPAAPQDTATSPPQGTFSVQRLPPPPASVPTTTTQPTSADAPEAKPPLPVLGITPKSTNWPHAWPLPASKPK